MTESEMDKNELTKELINEMPFYFAYEIIREKIKSKTSIEDSTLQTYLSREVTAGNLFDAGKGWYSRLKKEFSSANLYIYGQLILKKTVPRCASNPF